MSEFKVKRDRQKVYIEEDRPGDGTYHAEDFQRFAREFSERHPVPPSAVGLRFWGRCECGETVSARIHMRAHRDETDDEMKARIEREEYDAERGVKNARARERQRREDDLHILKLLTERLGKDTVLKALEGTLEP